METQLVDYVRTKPLKSILIAAGVGALFGLLISRR
ncbi:MAG: ElaB/YgaM/YqjD family protein [Planctomycetota bacterium]